MEVCNTFARQFPRYCAECPSICHLMDLYHYAEETSMWEAQLVVDKAVGYRVMTKYLEVQDLEDLWSRARTEWYTTTAFNWVADRLWAQRSTGATEVTELYGSGTGLYDALMKYLASRERDSIRAARGRRTRREWENLQSAGSGPRAPTTASLWDYVKT